MGEDRNIVYLPVYDFLKDFSNLYCLHCIEQDIIPVLLIWLGNDKKYIIMTLSHMFLGIILRYDVWPSDWSSLGHHTQRMQKLQGL